jgi:hypothetical protein
MAGLLRTIAYIDGFNLYYRMLKIRPAMKWLNPKALIESLLHPSFTVTRVNYYTARVSARAHDPEAPARQAIYLKALSTVPDVVVHASKRATLKIASRRRWPRFGRRSARLRGTAKAWRSTATARKKSIAPR